MAINYDIEGPEEKVDPAIERWRRVKERREQDRLARQQMIEAGIRPDQMVPERQPTQTENSGYGEPVPKVIRGHMNKKRAIGRA